MSLLLQVPTGLGFSVTVVANVARTSSYGLELFGDVRSSTTSRGRSRVTSRKRPPSSRWRSGGALCDDPRRRWRVTVPRQVVASRDIVILWTVMCENS